MLIFQVQHGLAPPSRLSVSSLRLSALSRLSCPSPGHNSPSYSGSESARPQRVQQCREGKHDRNPSPSHSGMAKRVCVEVG